MFLSCICNAQMLNYKGKKMVSRVEVYYNENNTPLYTYDFGYDSYKRLTDIVRISKGRRTVWQKRNGKLIRIDYYGNGQINKNNKYIYKFNEFGVLKEMVNNIIYTTGDVIPLYYTFEYGAGKLTGLIMTERNDFMKKSYEYVNDNCYFSSFAPNNYNPKIEEKGSSYYSDAINDTNINFFYLTKDSRDCFTEMATEWLPTASRNLIENNFSNHYSYDYDDRDNIKEIMIYTRLNGDYKTLKIFYLE